MEQSVQTESLAPQATVAPQTAVAPQETAAPETATPPWETQAGEYQAGPELEAERTALAGAREQARMERARLTAEEQVRQIGKLDGRIQSLSDLIAMPEYGEFYGLVKKGMDLVQAYKLTCYDRLMQQTAEAASRQTMRSVASRQHLTALAGQPGESGPSAVPADVAAEFRLAKPGISDQEIRRKWRRYQNYKRQ
ncbi:MAG: hypothetical protein LUC89_01130 [Oscillospiraceae bacterium]|nr:hypothetical protein [Oscillospiraceae bacterium]